MSELDIKAIAERRADYESTVDDVDALIGEVERLRSQRDQLLKDAPWFLADALFDDAHENCDEEGCSGGGLPYYQELVKYHLMPVLRGFYAEAEAAS